KNAERNCALSQKPGHFKQNKWIGDPGTVDPRTLGKRENYTHKMDIEAEPGTRAWLKPFETKPSTEPDRYEIPHDKLDEFNKRIRSVKASEVNPKKKKGKKR